MPKHVSQNELGAVLQAVSGFSEGAGIEEISTALSGNIPRRTLQRRLALLVEQGRIEVSGRARASRYRLPVITGDISVTFPAPAVEFHGEVYVPISSEGRELRREVRRPLQGRRPVGYNRTFLDAYRPNNTFYLSSDIRQQLYEMGRPSEKQDPAGARALKIYNRLLIDLSWNSSRLEGNTYSLLETELLLEQGKAAEGKDARDAQMILNHKAAIEFLVKQAAGVGFNDYTIFNLHGLLSDNLLADTRACGLLRKIPVTIGGSVYHPLEVPQLIEECFRQILATATEIRDPLEQSFFIIVQLSYLQPFEDVNKRVSRLAANIPLIRDNLSPVSFVDVPVRAYIDGIVAVYELNRVELLRDVFVWAYKRSCARYSAVQQSLGEPDPFRLKYRTQISEYVTGVVCNDMGKQKAVNWIAEKVKVDIAADDRPRFIEVVETELGNLHEGNIARYRLRPAEFSSWQEGWK